MVDDAVLFDANGPVGCGATSAPDFATCEDMLRHMDRLGIARSLVWSTQARDHHPAIGNQRLLAELDALRPADRKRLVPSLVIAPTMLYENHSTEELVALVRSGRTRALRVCPRTLRHKLPHLAPLLAQVAPYQPVLFVDVREVPDERELFELASAFPRMPIVCLHGMWPWLFNFSLLDLMRRCPNILIDNSMHHTRGTAERIVRDYGMHRMVFATACKSDNGASIAHLQHLPVGPEAHEAIAHGNLEQLLGLEPTARPAAASRPAPKRTAPTLWQKLRAGRRLGLDIIDAHGHLGSEGVWPLTERDMDEQIPAALRWLDTLSIRTMIVSGQDALFSDPVAGNRKLEDKAGRHGERFRGYLTFNPFYEQSLLPQLDDFFSRPFFVGFKSICDYWQVPVTDKRFHSAYQYCHEHRLPFLIHTWDGHHDSPAMLKDVAKEYPNAIFLLGHSGGGDRGRMESVELALANPNVYLEFCGSFCSRIPWEETLKQVGRDRVVFGTDAVFHDFAWELGRFLSIDLPDEDLIPALGANMRRILRMRR